jgi:cytochrome c oxidase cbb3-type subunit IV
MNMLASIGELLSTIWTLWAVCIFALIAFWAWRPANRDRFESDAHIPLNDEG